MTRIATSISWPGTLVLLLDLVNPLRDPSLTVAAVLTFLEEVGQPDSVWWVAAVALINLLVVRITVRLVTLAVLGCLLFFRSGRNRKTAGAGVVQGERTMDPYTFTYRDVLFRVFFGYPNRYHMYYGIQAERSGEQAYGWIRYARLDLVEAQIECLVFFEGAGWLRAVFASPDDNGWAVTPAFGPSSCQFSVAPEDAFLLRLAEWMLADYRLRFYDLVALLEAGDEPPADYRILWYYELCRACEINPCEEPTPRELAAAFRLVEAHASFEVREHAARERRQAKLQRRALEMGRWNSWVSQHLLNLEKTSVFPIEKLRSLGCPVTFATSCHDVAVSYEPICLDGNQGTGYLETFADTTIAYVPREVAQRWYRERWQRERGPVGALHVLNCMLRSGGKGIDGDDYMSWVFAHEGEETLVALARAGAPINVSWHLVYTCAIASKYYRIPVAVLLEDEHYVGYGVPGIHHDGVQPEGPLQGEAWQRVLRLHGWVFFGEEERGIWPGAPDIADHQREVHRLYTGLPVVFG
jgi:hypothetical protein